MSAETAQDFVKTASAGGIFEVESSKAVQGKAQDKAINEFAQKMIDDHGAANAKLQTIAGEQNSRSQQRRTRNTRVTLRL